LLAAWGACRGNSAKRFVHEEPGLTIEEIARVTEVGLEDG